MTGFIGVGQLKYILTNLGEKMSDDEVDELLKAVDTSSGQVNYTGQYRYARLPAACLLTASARPRPHHPRQLRSPFVCCGGPRDTISFALCGPDGVNCVSCDVYMRATTRRNRACVACIE